MKHLAIALLFAGAASGALAAPAMTPVDANGVPISFAPAVPNYPASGVTPVTGALVSSTNTAAFTPNPGRTFYLELTGTGSVTGKVVFLSNDGSTYVPEAVATDGGSPVIMNSIAYNGGTQNGVRMALQVDQASVSVKFSPGTVTGTVNFAFVQ